MSTEETPLLADGVETHNDVYRRFSPRRKKAIIGMVSGCGLIPFFVTGTFTPSISQIARDLDTTGSVVNYAISVSWIAASLGGLIGGSYSTFYGRRVIYTFSLPIVALGSIGVATSRDVPSLLFWRFFQSLGASPSQVLGAGVIGDVYKLEERGRAMAIFFATCLIGPSLAPIAGGWVTFYYSWRTMQASLGAVAFISFVFMFTFFPETSQPGTRGIDKLRTQNGPDSQNKKIGFVFINPFRLMLLLRSPNLLAISVILSASLMTVFAGAIVVGRISDYTVIKWRKKRGGIWYPEDRLRAAIVPMAILVPISLIAYGVVNHFVDGQLGLTICLACLFLNGLGVEMAFGPCAAYLIDVMHSRSAEALAANSGLRSILVATGIAFVLPMINHFGIAITNTIFALNTWIAFGLLCCIIKYGDQMRAWIDVGFSTTDNN
ncbi:hypothetical protein CVT25_001822 [Psilocybe cyanescens]|uniref:Major facilitator superfamily (MFS) profile domain-containing protein n=1 Tax=Psilocybe cyanescens TaxID=93625 RepID=A0A409WQC8_PSICY|nr:hypothetical protein CVT25_001822 [Psilocybe cyanescens]